MFGIIESVSEWALNLIDQSGYFGIFILSLLESAAILIPSEVVIPFSGFLAAGGRFDFWLVVVIATAANLTGSVVLFFIGRRGFRLAL